MIPSEIREMLNICPGDKVNLEVYKNEVKIINANKIIDEMYSIFTKNQSSRKDSVVDDFINRKYEEYKIEEITKMANQIVFDLSALIMLFAKEPGYESIRQNLKHAIISSVNLPEVYKYCIAVQIIESCLFPTSAAKQLNIGCSTIYREPKYASILVEYVNFNA